MITDDDFISVLRSKASFELAVRGHIAIDHALNHVLVALLAEGHTVEVSRISFLLKVDIAVGLQALPAESRGLYVKLNSIRNRFAHRADATLTEKDMREVKAAMSKRHRVMTGEHFENAAFPHEALRVGVAAAFFECKSTIEGIEHRKLEREAIGEEIEILLAETKAKPSGMFKERVRVRIEKKRQASEAQKPEDAQPGHAGDGYRRP